MSKINQRLFKKYEDEIVPKLMEEFDIKNKMAVPKLTKIVINSGIGNVAKNKEFFDKFKSDLAIITGQVPSVRQAKISVASFNLRKGMTVGVKTTLRRDRMYSFLDRLISIVLPRLRDFRGLSQKSFDKGGNYSIGIGEHTVFPEVDITKSTPHGFEITLVVNTQNADMAKRLLTLIGLPFTKDELGQASKNK